MFNFNKNICVRLLSFFLYFACLLFSILQSGKNTEIPSSGLYDQIINSRYQGLSILATNQDIQNAHGDDDSASYARGGKHWVEQRGFVEKGGYLGCWAPGMFILHGIIYEINQNAPVVLIFILIIAFLWSAVFTQLFMLLRNHINLFLSFFLPLTFLYFNIFRDYYLHQGIVFSEPFSVAFFCLGLGFSVQAWHTKKFPILAGMFFALASYMRAQFDFSICIFSIIPMITCSFYFWKNFSSSNGIKSIINSLPKWLCSACIIVGTYHAATLPYRIYYMPSWVSLEFRYAYPWLKSEELLPAGGFVIDGGGTAACAINPEKCNELKEIRDVNKKNKILPYGLYSTYKHELIKTFLTHPIAWFIYKAPFMVRYWFNEGTNFNTVSLKILTDNILFSVLLVLSIIFLVLSGPFGIISALLASSVLGFGLLSTYVFHIEARYLDLSKIIGFYTFFLGICLYLKRKAIDKQS